MAHIHYSFLIVQIMLCHLEVKPCCGDEGQIEPFSLPCKVTFISPKPVSFAQSVKFTFKGCDKPFTLLVTATADNCLLTCYPFLALHRTDHQIVCEQVNLCVCVFFFLKTSDVYLVKVEHASVWNIKYICSDKFNIGSYINVC